MTARSTTVAEARLGWSSANRPGWKGASPDAENPLEIPAPYMPGHIADRCRPLEISSAGRIGAGVSVPRHFKLSSAHELDAVGSKVSGVPCPLFASSPFLPGQRRLHLRCWQCLESDLPLSSTLSVRIFICRSVFGRLYPFDRLSGFRLHKVG
ncbi:hypothetical protein VTK56DRAFT_1937 [Thermocarpiscus australiensis]